MSTPVTKPTPEPGPISETKPVIDPEPIAELEPTTESVPKPTQKPTAKPDPEPESNAKSTSKERTRVIPRSNNATSNKENDSANLNKINQQDDPPISTSEELELAKDNISSLEKSEESEL